MQLHNDKKLNRTHRASKILALWGGLLLSMLLLMSRCDIADPEGKSHPQVAVSSLITRDASPALYGTLYNAHSKEIVVSVAGQSTRAEYRSDTAWIVPDNTFCALQEGVWDVTAVIYDSTGEELTRDSSENELTILLPDSSYDKNRSIKVLRPNGGEKYRIGDTMRIVWRKDSVRFTTGLSLTMSTNNGLNWYTIIDKDIDELADYSGEIGFYEWIVQPFLDYHGDTMWLSSDNVKVKAVGPYEDSTNTVDYDVSDSVFMIVDSG